MTNELTPLDQLNLMLWMCLESAGGPIRPIFWENGFQLWGIGPTLDLPSPLFNRVSKAGIPVKQSLAPEMVLHGDGNNLVVPLECKTNSFGPEATGPKHQVYQANALLCLSGEIIADYIGLSAPSKWSSHVLFVVSGPNEKQQQETLDELRSILCSASITASPAGSFGIYIYDDGIYLCPGKKNAIPIASLSASEPVKVVDIAPGNDADLLNLLPYDPSVDKPNAIQKRIVEEKIRTALAVSIASKIDQKVIKTTVDEVTGKAFEIWSYWRDKNAKSSFKKQVRTYIKYVLGELQNYLQKKRNPIKIKIEGGEFIILESVDLEVAQLIVRFFRSVGYRRGEVNLWGIESGEQLDLLLPNDKDGGGELSVRKN